MGSKRLKTIFFLEYFSSEADFIEKISAPHLTSGRYRIGHNDGASQAHKGDLG